MKGTIVILVILITSLIIAYSPANSAGVIIVVQPDGTQQHCVMTSSNICTVI